jgi:hypothetical protein
MRGIVAFVLISLVLWYKLRMEEQWMRTLKIKSLSDGGTFQGLAAVYGNVDLGGDSIAPGAFAST